MKLIAKWNRGQETSIEAPVWVVWEDGSPATLADYRAHEIDTRILHSNDDGEMECHVFCDIVADVSFEQNVQDWVMRGQGVVPAGLDVKNPNALDCDIYAALIRFRPSSTRCGSSAHNCGLAQQLFLCLSKPNTNV